MTDLSWTEENITDELAGALRNVASYLLHKPGSERVVEAVVAKIGDSEVVLLDDLRALVARKDHEVVTAGMSDAELHRRCWHPDFEYASTEGPRKQWDDADTPPDGDDWVRNVHVGDRGWERFDYTEESYWMRPKVGP